MQKNAPAFKENARKSAAGVLRGAVVPVARKTRAARRPRVVRNPAETRSRLVGATLRLMMRQGFAATSVDEICAESGLTKGSFFHYFENKQSIGQAALDCFADIGTEVYSPAWEDSSLDPLEQLYLHLDIMVDLAKKDDPLVCMVGMLSQEMSATNLRMRKACCTHLTTWTDRVAKMLAAAKRRHRPAVNFDPESVAWMLNSLWQGSMLIAKTRQRQDMVVSNLEHGRAYVRSLFSGSALVGADTKGRRNSILRKSA